VRFCSALTDAPQGGLVQALVVALFAAAVCDVFELLSLLLMLLFHLLLFGGIGILLGCSLMRFRGSIHLSTDVAGKLPKQH
jgi:hypothetical protein